MLGKRKSAWTARIGLGLMAALIAMLILSVFVSLNFRSGKRDFVLENGAVRVHSHAWSEDPHFVLFYMYAFNMSWVPNLWPVRKEDDVVMPLWIPLFVIGLPTAVSFYRARRSKSLGQRGVCERCGYDLTGNSSGVCPECGTPISRDDGGGKGASR